MEEEELSLKLLEKYLPRFFARVFEFYYNEEGLDENHVQHGHRVANSNPLSKSVTNFTRQNLLKSPVFTLEYEFYDFIKQRLHMQARDCGIE